MGRNTLLDALTMDKSPDRNSLIIPVGNRPTVDSGLAFDQQDGEMLKGFRRASSGVVAGGTALKAAVEDLWNRDQAAKDYLAAQQYAQDASIRNPAAVQSLKDVTLGNALQYGAGSIGEAIPSMALAMVGGRLGARALGRYAPNFVKASPLAAEMVGGAGVMLPLEAGETAMDLGTDPTAIANTTPWQRAGIIAGKGAVNSVLEAAVPAALGSKLAGGAMAEQVAKGQALKHIAKTAGQGMLGEGATEGAQELVGTGAHILANPNVTVDPWQIADAVAKGGLPGAGMGVMGGVADVARSRLTDGTPGDLSAKAGEKVLDGVAGAGDVIGKGAAKAAGLMDRWAQGRRARDSGEDFLHTFVTPVNSEDPAELEASFKTRLDAGSRYAKSVLGNPDAHSDKELEDAHTFLGAVESGVDPTKAFGDYWNNVRASTKNRELRGKMNEIVDDINSRSNRRGNAQTPAEGTEISSDDNTMTQMAKLWMKRNKDVTDVFQDLHSPSDETLNGAKTILGWVRSNFGADHNDGKMFVPKSISENLGEHAPRMVLDAYESLVTQGLMPRNDKLAKHAVAAIKEDAASTVDRKKIITDSLTPLAREGVSLSDVRSLDKALKQYVRLGTDSTKATEESPLNPGTKVTPIRAELERTFGPQLDKVLEAYGKDVRPNEVGSEYKREYEIDPETGEIIDYAGDVSAENEVAPKVQYHGSFDTDHPEYSRKVQDFQNRKQAELPNSNLKLVGEHAAIKEQFDGDAQGLRNAEDALIAKRAPEARLNPADKDARARLLKKIDGKWKTLREETMDDSDGLSQINPKDLKPVTGKKNAEGKVERIPHTADNGFLFLERNDGTMTPTTSSKLLALANKAGVDVGNLTGGEAVKAKVLHALGAVLTQEGFTGRIGTKSVDTAIAPTWTTKNKIPENFAYTSDITEADTKTPPKELTDADKKSEVRRIADYIRGFDEAKSQALRTLTKKTASAKDGFERAMRELGIDSRDIGDVHGVATQLENEARQTYEQGNDGPSDTDPMLRSSTTDSMNVVPSEVAPDGNKPIERNKLDGTVAKPEPTGSLVTGNDTELVKDLKTKEAARKQPTAEDKKQWVIDKLNAKGGVPAFVAHVKTLATDKVKGIITTLREVAGSSPSEVQLRARNALTVLLGKASVEKVEADLKKHESKVAGRKPTSLLSRGSETTPATAVTTEDAHKAADVVTGKWSTDAAKVEFADTFSALPQAVQDGVDKKDHDTAKGIFHPDSNTIWVVLDKHSSQADVEETLYHEGGHWGTLTELGANAIEKLSNSFDKLGVPAMLKIAREHGFDKQFAKDLATYNESKKGTFDRAKLLAELLAGVAQKAPYRSWPQKLRDAVGAVVGAIRNWLKANNYVELSKLNEADVLNLVAKGNKRLFSGGKNVKGLPAFLMTLSQEIHNALGKEGFAATHDSPIRHEGKFDWRAHQGKGEGNAAFGAGTYLSTADGVHRAYKRQFTAQARSAHRSFEWGNDFYEYDDGDGTVYKNGSSSLTPAEDAFAYAILVNGSSPQEALTEAIDSAYNIVDRSAEETSDHISLSELHVSTADLSYVLKSFRERTAMDEDRVHKNLKPFFSVERWNRMVDRADKKAAELRAMDVSSVKVAAGLKSPTYHVTVNAKPEELLDWDAPLSEQSELVKKALLNDRSDLVKLVKAHMLKEGLRRYDSYANEITGESSLKEIAGYVKDYLGDEELNTYGDDKVGSKIYHGLTDLLGSQAAASDYLQSLGIVGHKYAASGGRNDKFPNYVIYDDSRIETNYVHFNAQSAQKPGKAQEPGNDAKAQIRAEVEKTLGDKIKLAFAKVIKGPNGEVWSGEWSPQRGIRIALGALDPVGVARHESIHQLFQWLREAKADGIQDLLKTVATNKIVNSQLRRLLANDKNALKQLDDPEEAAAYLYQFWKAGLISLGPKAETFFQKVAKFLREVTGLLSKEMRDAKRAEAIMTAFSEGVVSKDHNAVIKAMEQNEQVQRAVAEQGLGAIKAFRQNKTLQKIAFTAASVLEDTKNPAFMKLSRLFHTPEGETMGKQGMFEATAQQRAHYLNKLRDILHSNDREDIDAALKHLQSKTKLKNIHDPVVNKIVKDVRSYLNDMYEYMQSRGMKRFDEETNEWVPIPKIETNFFPVVMDIEALMKDPGAFTKRLLEVHPKELEHLAKQANEERLKGQDKSSLLAKDQVPVGREITPEDIAEAILKRMTESAGAKDITESTSSLGITPYAKSVNKRTLYWLDHSKFTDFMEKDLVRTLTNYTVQVVKRGEYVSRLGQEGEVVNDTINEAYTHELFNGDAKQIAAAQRKLKAMQKAWYDNKAKQPDLKEGFPTLRQAADSLLTGPDAKSRIETTLAKMEMPIKAIMAGEGTLGKDIDPNLRTLIGGVTAYQNARLMALSLFTSFADPLGIMVRGGEMSDAFNAFTRGVKEVWAGWKGEFSTDEASKLAEEIGTVDAGTFLDALGETYSSVYVQGKLKKFNDTLFNLNGMEAWNRAMRISATWAAKGFIERHLTRPNEHSARYLKDELNLDTSDKTLLKDGKLDTSREDVRQAIMRWVDGAILRPNAMQRPIMASDPHYALFYHLKQFTYSFHKTILKRAYVEAQHGNYMPASTLVAGYVPVMVAADVLKEMIVPGDDPEWMKAGLGSYVRHGVSRANLLGIPQIGLDAMSNPFSEKGSVANSVERGAGILGPQVDQVAKILTNPFDDKRGAVDDVVAAMPGTTVLSRMAGTH